MNSSLFDGEYVADVHIFGQTVDIYIRPRTEEIDRRAAVGVGAIVEDYMIRALMNVPEGVPIELRALDGATLLAMEGAVGCARDRDRRRHRVPASDPARRPRRDHQGRPRMVRRAGDHISGYSRPSGRGRCRSGSLGATIREIDPEVGVAIVEESDCVVLRRPGATAVRPSWQRWSIAETAYRDVADAGAEPRTLIQASKAPGLAGPSACRGRGDRSYAAAACRQVLSHCAAGSSALSTR